MRAEAAQANMFETVALYAAGVIAANTAGVDKSSLNKLALAYVLTRMVYTMVYVRLQDNPKFAPVRSIAWIASISIIFSLFVKAGLKLP
jgi:uncharacterized MAPEG superfamily protein